MNTLHAAPVSGLLDRLFADSVVNDAPIMERLRHVRGSGPLDDRLLAGHFSSAYIPVDRHTGRLLYVLAKANRSRFVVEFGTSFGISTIHLAAAVRDNGGGRVTTSELVPEKVRRAKAHLTEAGLVDLVEFREGDALQTLADIGEPIDMLFLDGWKALYLPVLKLLEGTLRPGAIIVADDLNIMPEMIRPYLDYVRDPAHGYDSVELPVGDGLELSVRSF
ncbi:O-methyltransferase [Frigoriglobus tundricola]|uniref:Putative SAM-dependent O-methyltransferase n=1 Tax=Frigoriglobus tundricola TaxID=2774151 RepID=A0A6M5YQB1_9BACT|nr:class I SAM-dependent methyltransferase [Frigoriglobus tundricola]QJW95162.1 putative SAM-dependent O-methyltransferase [Frigoriglobus tundricola]